MKYYFSGVHMRTTPKSAEYLIKNGGHILLSQLNDRKEIKQLIEVKKEGNCNFELMVDSGAFSAWTVGKKIDMDDYINFLNENFEYIDVMVSVDVIPGDSKSNKVATNEEVELSAKQTWDNYLYMRSKLKDPSKLMYTYHIGEPISYLERALNYSDEFGKIQYMGLGAMVGKSDKHMISFYTETFDVIKKSSNPDIKVHAFGMTQLDIMRKFPELYSVDSTTALNYSIYRKVSIDEKVYVCTDREGAHDSLYYQSDDFKKHLQEKLDKEYEGVKISDLPENQDLRMLVSVIDISKSVNNLQYKKVKKAVSLW